MKFEKGCFHSLQRGSLLLMGLFVLCLLQGCRTTLPPNTLSFHDATEWENEIAAYEARDRTNRPPEGSILFVGSSSIRLWKTLAQDFPQKPVVNRGFGGSHLADAVFYADRIIVPYRPRQVIIFAGVNDIAAGKDPELVYGDFVALVKKIRKELPRTEIAYISAVTNPARWGQVEKVKRLNDLVKEYCARAEVEFIDVFPQMLQANGEPKPDIFVSDRLHMNAKGYALWKEAVEPYLN